MDDCTNCYYRVYCKRAGKFFSMSPCSIILPDGADLLRQIDLITEDLHAQYDE